MVCNCAELEHFDRPNPGLVAAGLAHSKERPFRIDIVADPHGAPLFSGSMKRGNNKTQDVDVPRSEQLLLNPA